MYKRHAPQKVLGDHTGRVFPHLRILRTGKQKPNIGLHRNRLEVRQGKIELGQSSVDIFQKFHPPAKTKEENLGSPP